jgi:hypothetical protein
MPRPSAEFLIAADAAFHASAIWLFILLVGHPVVVGHVLSQTMLEIEKTFVVIVWPSTIEPTSHMAHTCIKCIIDFLSGN